MSTSGHVHGLPGSAGKVTAAYENAGGLDAIHDRAHPIPKAAAYRPAESALDLRVPTGGAIDHKTQRMHDALSVDSVTPVRRHVKLGMLPSVHDRDRFGAPPFGAQGTATKADVHDILATAIHAGPAVWSRARPPDGESERTLSTRIHMLMKEYGEARPDNTARAWAIAKPGDPICRSFGVPPQSRDRIIALAARACYGDRFGLAPPMAGCALTKSGELCYSMNRVWIVHGTNTLNMVANPGLANLVLPRWCVRADLDKLLPGIGNARDMVGMPWATMTIRDREHGKCEWDVYNPHDAKQKVKTAALELDATPLWEYTPEAVESMLRGIYHIETEENTQPARQAQ